MIEVLAIFEEHLMQLHLIIVLDRELLRVRAELLWLSLVFLMRGLHADADVSLMASLLFFPDEEAGGRRACRSMLLGEERLDVVSAL